MKTIRDIMEEIGISAGGAHGMLKSEGFPSGRFLNGSVVFTDEEFETIITLYKATRITKAHKEMLRRKEIYTSKTAADDLEVSRDMFLSYVEKNNVPYETKSGHKIFSKKTIDGLRGKKIRKNKTKNNSGKPESWENPLIPKLKRKIHPCSNCGKKTTNYLLCDECYRGNSGCVGDFEYNRSVSF